MDEAIPILQMADDDDRPSLAIPEMEEVPPCAHKKPETEARTTTGNAPLEIPGQNWSGGEVVGVRADGNGDGRDGDDDEATGVAGDAHCPSYTSASSASSLARLALGGSDKGTANGRNRRGTATATSDDGTDHPWAR